MTKVLFVCVFLLYIFYREDTLKQRWSSNLYNPVLLEKTDFITGIGSLCAKEDFLLKLQIPESGVTTALRKRCDCFATVEIPMFGFLVVTILSIFTNSLMHSLDHSTPRA